MIRILIVDDERVIREDLTLLLQRHTDFNIVGVCSTIAEARALIGTTRPDLLLLDIRLRDGTSFDLLDSLEKMSFHIIFITAFFDRFAIKAIEYAALDYVFKPIDEDRLLAALERARRMELSQVLLRESLAVAQEHYNHQREDGLQRIVLRSQHTFQVIMVSEILYCESSGTYTNFYLASNRKLVASRPLIEYEKLLPKKHFLRCHNSYLVNFQYVDHFHVDGHLALKSGQQVPVARRRREDVIAFLS